MAMSAPELQTIAVVLTKDQVRRLRDLAAARSTATNRMSVSATARDVVERGFATLFCDHDSDSLASDTMRGENAA